jgi:hypothetical protein
MTHCCIINIPQALTAPETSDSNTYLPEVGTTIHLLQMEAIAGANAPLSNYSGALFFWLYIVAALLLTYVATSTIRELHLAGRGESARRHLRDDSTIYFIVLAGLSFATLSSNMLGVLIQSFMQWSQQTWVASDLQGASLLMRIWRWSITSTLFRDFGEAIVANEARYFWTSSALLVTMAVCTYMGIDGTFTQLSLPPDHR